MRYPTTEHKLKQLICFIPLKYPQISKGFPVSTFYIYIIITILLAIFFSCNRDQTYVERGVEKEKQGNIAEALHSYNQAFKINPDNKVANERIGFLLSESQFSIIPAIYHLENARSHDLNSIQIPLKLIDLTLFISDFSKAKRIQKEISNQIPKEMNELLSLVTSCLETNNPKDKAKSIETLSMFQLSEDTHWIYRSLALCYETGGDSLKAEEIASKYKKQDPIPQ
jgi:tetratricopeptide (TPR) repeat protein